MRNANPIARSPLALALTIATLVVAAWIVWLGPARAAATVASEWPVALTMVFGSFIAGASSEGGGAVAFPVFTKVLGVAPGDAKLFALMIQSVGMSAASIAIFAMRVRVDLRAIALASVGGVAGVALGLLWIAPVAPAPNVRVVFTAMQAGFAVALVMSLRASEGRAAIARLQPWSGHAGLIGTGVFGGVASGLVGSGLDLALFAVLTLRFGVSEKIATPTSVVVMAINSVAAVVVYGLAVGPPPAGVVSMWLAAVPVVVFGAPAGAWFCSRLRRGTIGWLLVGLISIEVATTIILVPMTATAATNGLIIAATFGCVCLLMARRRKLDRMAQIDAPIAASGATAL